MTRHARETTYARAPVDADDSHLRKVSGARVAHGRVAQRTGPLKRKCVDHGVDLAQDLWVRGLRGLDLHVVGRGYG